MLVMLGRKIDMSSGKREIRFKEKAAHTLTRQGAPCEDHKGFVGR